MPQEQKSSTFQTTQNFVFLLSLLSLLQNTLIIKNIKRGGSKSENFDPNALKEKVATFTRATGRFKDYSVTQKGLSMTDM